MTEDAMPPVTVTSLIITYNHARFIEEAVESVLSQETEFDYEVIISDDHSTDGTQEIIQRIAADHPDRVRLFISERNLCDNTVLRRGVDAARGKYFTLLDGDDRWITTDKLQRQVDYLEARPDAAMCFHNARVVYDDGTPSNLYHQDEPAPMSTPKPKPVSTLEDVAPWFFIPTCSVMFRTEHLRDMPAWYDACPAGDHPLHVFAAQRGYVGYLDAVMAEYRVHAGGLWATRGKFRTLEHVEETVEGFDAVRRHLAPDYDDLMNDRIAWEYRNRALDFYESGDYEWAAVCARRSLARLPLRRRAMALKRIALFGAAKLRSLGRGSAQPSAG